MRGVGPPARLRSSLAFCPLPHLLLESEPSKYSHSPTVRKGVVVPLLERRLGRVRDYAGVSPADPLKPPVSPWRARSLRSGVEG